MKLAKQVEVFKQGSKHNNFKLELNKEFAEKLSTFQATQSKLFFNTFSPCWTIQIYYNPQLCEDQTT